MDGDALNGLTRQEWNAAYFIGLERILKGEETGNLSAQVAAGVRELRRSGYRFARLRFDGEGRPAPFPGALPGEHDHASREILTGNFDQIGRAREALAWLREKAEPEKTGWLHGLLGLYDRIHAPLAGSSGVREFGSSGVPGFENSGIRGFGSPQLPNCRTSELTSRETGLERSCPLQSS